MKRMFKIWVLGMLLALAPSLVHAQDEEYTWELGASVGGSFYMGDANFSKPFKDTGAAGGLMARRLLNPHMAIKANLTAGRISGDTRDFDNAYPDGAWTSFRRTVFDLGAQFEYNFLGYGTNAYRGDRRFTPYILGGAGLTLATRGSNTFTVNFPVGAGIKYKVASRVNIGCELTMRFTLSDCLDMEHESGLQLNDPYQIKGKGLKNKDSYACVLFFLTYDLFPKCKECNN